MNKDIYKVSINKIIEFENGYVELETQPSIGQNLKFNITIKMKEPLTLTREALLDSKKLLLFIENEIRSLTNNSLGDMK